MKKAELRKKYLSERKALTKESVSLLSEAVFTCFASEFSFRSGAKVHVFLSIPHLNEVDTSFFIRYFFEIGCRVFVPKMKGNQLLSVELTPKTPLESNSWGIVEPLTDEDSGETTYDCVITPLLYCDSEGNRIGYGKGFYDRFFAALAPGVMKIGVGFFAPQEKISDVEASDIPLDYLVIPDRILSFKGRL
ncbi:5-formyltetrahydrofolate cyclo-ligase [Bergeyella sp. RCAD1439]|uniref:5-formyltetrahydrofolate cyclo-ligase n=1 Tax=Bergeyella anatis TaxID=3113737 RepID=UPI002E16D487|nr:5-formyltetrahydrofolate cyclo-ligase [Bergeyella sp. RCAD1439]